MEENNRKGPGVFYAVVGVATLVVAIIGATFAYFSASATPDTTTVTGQTNNITGSNLTLTVTKLFEDKIGTGAGKLAATQNLVPADFNDASTTDITNAITNYCIDDGYTGCHMYDIMIKCDQTISEANLLLDLAVTPISGGSKDNWKYLVFQQSNTATSTLSAANTITTSATSLATDETDEDLHSRNGNAAGLTANTEVHYFLMVYLKNIDAAQNDSSATNEGETTYEFGSYSGSLELHAMGGEVKATFSAS